MAEYNHHSHSILMIGLVVVLLLLSNIYATTVLAGRWMIHHPTDHPTDHQEKKLGGGDPTTRLALITLRRVLESLNAELIRSGESARFVLVPLRRRRSDVDRKEPAALNFKLEIRPAYKTMGGYRTLGVSDFARRAAAKDFARRAAANRVKTRRPIFRFRSDPDSKQQALGMPESKGGGTRIVYWGGTLYRVNELFGDIDY